MEGPQINVCVRKRPLRPAECRRGQADAVTTPSGECVVVHESKEAVDLTEYILQVVMKGEVGGGGISFLYFVIQKCIHFYAQYVLVLSCVPAQVPL